MISDAIAPPDDIEPNPDPATMFVAVAADKPGQAHQLQKRVSVDEWWIC